MQHILKLIEEYRLADAFQELDKLGISNPQLSKMKQEFIHGNTGFDFIERLRVLVQNLPQNNSSTANNSNPEKPDFDQLRDLIAKDKIEKVIQTLKTITQDTDNENLMLMQAARWNSLKNDSMMGMIAQEDANVQKARITQALLHLISELEDENS